MASSAGVLKHRDLFPNWVFAFAVALSKHDGFIKYQFVLTSVKTRIMKIVEKSLRGRENTPLVSHLLKRLLGPYPVKSRVSRPELIPKLASLVRTTQGISR